MRALAALSVAFAHFAGGFARHIDGRLDGLPSLDHAAQSAVALFFVISGCVMVVSSQRLFGQAAGTVEFWRRRVARVVPPYWIATGLFLAVSLALDLPARADEIVKSLLFVPYRPAIGNGLVQPFLWPGWTLFYEMTFYALFGCFVFAGRTWTIALTSLSLVALVGAGHLAAPQSVVAQAFTRPVLLLFIAGMVMGLAIGRGWTMPGWARIASLLLACLAIYALPGPAAALDLGFAYALWAGVPAIFLFAAALGGPLRIRFARAAGLAGDASYAIYLLHVPLAHAWMPIFLRLHYPGGSLGYVATALGLLIVLSILFHRHVEVPLTARLNALLRGARAKA